MIYLVIGIIFMAYWDFTNKEKLTDFLKVVVGTAIIFGWPVYLVYLFTFNSRMRDE